MPREKWNMSDEHNRWLAQERAFSEARSYVMGNYPHIPREDAEITDLIEHLLSSQLETIEPSSEWLFRDLFKRHFLGKYKELLSFYDERQSRHEQYQHMADRNPFYGKDRPTADLLSSDISLKEFKRRIRKR